MGSSFAVPALGVKVDVYPGRINETSTFVNRDTIAYGQRGQNHSKPMVINYQIDGNTLKKS